MKATLVTLSSKPFIRFAIAGGIAALANILSRIALTPILGYSTSIVVAYLVGMTVAYVLMKFLVFEISGRTVSQEYLRFGLVNLVALTQVWIVSMVLTKLIFPSIGNVPHAETLAHVIGVLSPIATSYFLHKYFTFSGAR